MQKVLPDSNSFEISRILSALDKVIQVSLITFVIFSMFSISVTQISFALGALSWIVKVHLTKTWKELRGTWVGVMILFFCLAYVLSITSSVDLEGSFKYLKKLLQFVIFFWVANTVQNEKQRDLLVGILIFAGVATAMSGIWEMDFIKQDRIQGTRSTPATFSGSLMIVGLIALGRLLFHKPREYWVLGSVGIIGFCLLISMTRQAWLGFFIGSVFLLYFWKKIYFLIIPLLLAGVLLFAGGKITKRIQSLTDLKDSSFQARVFLWKGGWEIFKDHSITGCGYKCVDSVYSQYPDPSRLVAHYRGMHSNVLQLMVDTGIIGLGAWLLIWVAYFIEVLKRWKTLAIDKSRANSAGILMGTFAAVLAFLTGGFFETSIYDSEVTMVLYFLMGLSLAQIKATPEIK